MTWTLVQSATPVAGNGPGATIALSGVAAGNMLVVRESYFQGSNPTKPAVPTDTGGSLLVASVPNPNLSGASIGAACWYAPNCAAGTHTVVVTNATTGRLHVTFQEWNYSVAGVQGLDAGGSGNATTANSVNSGSTGTLDTASDLCLIAVAVGSGAGVANAAITDPPSGFTSDGMGSNTASDIAWEHAHQILSANTTLSATWGWTDATTVASQGIIVAFSPPVPPPNPGLIYNRRPVLYYT